MHHNNINTIAIGICQAANGMSPEIMNGIFKVRDNTYHLRHTSQFLVDPIHSIFNGSESASYLGPTTWQQIISEINTHGGFKKRLESENL